VNDKFTPMNLSQIKAGTKVKIKSFKSDDIVLKLMEMGCLPGEDITVWKRAPLGGPIYVLVAGYSLSLRLDEAAQIIVESIVTDPKPIY
jgi:ferrous iron transport protein A